ncbi:MAG: hypothetical protein WBG42_01535 [Cryomorphaceae bacterium]
MKKALFILTLVFTAVSTGSMAQSHTEEVDLVQSVFGMEKKAFVAEFIQAEGEQAEAFWTLYDEYETKRKELGKRRIALLNKYADSYDSLDDLKTDEILSEMMSLQAATDKLITTYSKKIKKDVNVKTAAQFYHIEGYIVSKIRTTILENIPMLGDM